MFSSPSEEARRFNTEVTDRLWSTIEHAGCERSLKLVTGLLCGDFLSLRHSFEFGFLCLKIFCQRAEVAFRKVLDFDPVVLVKTFRMKLMAASEMSRTGGNSFRTASQSLKKLFWKVSFLA
jgi:hypothetical protein